MVVRHRSCGGPGAMVVAAAILAGPAVMGQLLGARDRCPDQACDAPPLRVMEALAMRGFPGLRWEAVGPLCRHHPGIGVVVLRREGGLPTVRPRDLGPLLVGTVTTAIAAVISDDLAGPHPGRASSTAGAPLSRRRAPSPRRRLPAAASPHWTCQGMGQAAKRAPIQRKCPRSLTPTARQIPRRARRAWSRGAISGRCASAMRRSSARATHWHLHTGPGGCCVPRGRGPFVLHGLDPHHGPASLTSMAAVGHSQGG
jgi:hypothetical protein